MARWGRSDAVGIAILWVGRRIAGGGLQHRGGLLVMRVVRHVASGGSLRGVWLSRREMRRHIHIGLGLIHAAESGWAVIVAVVRRQTIFRIQRQAAVRELGRRGAVRVCNRSTGEAGTGARARTLLVDSRWGLSCGGKAERGEFVARQQRTFGRVVVIPGSISRTAGLDLRNRRQLQLFGCTENSWKKGKLERLGGRT